MTRAKKALSQAVLLISGAIMLGFGAMRGEVETVLSKANIYVRKVCLRVRCHFRQSTKVSVRHWENCFRGNRAK